MASIKSRHNKFEAKVRVPATVSVAGGPKFLYRTLQATSRHLAKVEASAWEAALRLEWANNHSPSTEETRASLRAAYGQMLTAATGGEFRVDIAGEDPVEAGIEYEMAKIGDRYAPDVDVSAQDQAKLTALHDAREARLGRPPAPRREYEPTFSELAADHMTWWKARGGLKDTNTEQQKRATFALFASYWQDQPIRGVGRPDAARFMDGLRHLDPSWARSPAGRAMSWADLQRTYGGRERGLADATRNRHAATLQDLWEWGTERGFAEGRNPFTGHRTRLRAGVNVRGYRPWEPAELERLFHPGPKRADLRELMLVAAYSGMRLDEIAGLRIMHQLGTEDTVHVRVDPPVCRVSDEADTES